MRERGRHESSDGEFEGVHIDQRRGSMTITCPTDTRGQKAQLPESLLNFSHHPNSVSSSASKEKLNHCHRDYEISRTCDNTEPQLKTIDVQALKKQVTEKPSDDIRDPLEGQQTCGTSEGK